MTDVIEMDDGRVFHMTRRVSKETRRPSMRQRGLAKIPCFTVWEAEYMYPRVKMGGTYTASERGFGVTRAAAIAACYNKLEEMGELDISYTPCESCGLGYRIATFGYAAHDAKCPAVNDDVREDKEDGENGSN